MSQRWLLPCAGVALLAVVAACSGQSSDSPRVQGEKLATQLGCRSCHTVNGQNAVGPTWLNLAGSIVELDDGTTVVADREYLRRSILEPGAQRVAPFVTEMPAFKLSPSEVAVLVTYIESLRPP